MKKITLALALLAMFATVDVARAQWHVWAGRAALAYGGYSVGSWLKRHYGCGGHGCYERPRYGYYRPPHYYYGGY
jgi:hypothetical protein